MISRNINVACVSLALLSLAVGFVQLPLVAANDAAGIGFTLNGLTGSLTGGLTGALDGLNRAGASAASASASASGSGGGLVPNIMGGVTGTVGGVVKPVMGLLGSLSGNLMGGNNMLGGVLRSTLGGINGLAGGDSANNVNMRLASGALDGITSGLGAGLTGLGRANGIGAGFGQNGALATGMGLRNNFKRQASSAAASAAASAGGSQLAGNSAAAASAASSAGNQLLGDSAAASSAAASSAGGNQMLGNAAASSAAAASAGNQLLGNSAAASAAASSAGGNQMLGNQFLSNQMLANSAASAGNQLLGNSAAASAAATSAAGSQMLGNQFLGNQIMGNSAAAAAAASAGGNQMLGNQMLGNQMLGGQMLGNQMLGNQMMDNQLLGNSAANAVANAGAAAAASTGASTGLGIGSDLDVAGAAANSVAANSVANSVANSGFVGDTAIRTLADGGLANSIDRDALAVDAARNAQAEAALAGSQMIAHGINNARSASLASNAYRQAKLANTRDRVNVAGTIQNSARISDAAIATHDAATRAEDSLLGSELAVDSAGTVLDSDAAYIPPVTSSLLRSLPYGRLGVRNIIPKPLNYPSPYLPDVWLNGKPVNYLNVPLSMHPYAFGGPYGGPYSTLNRAYGIYNGQPFVSNNGVIVNEEIIYDPVAYAYMMGPSNAINGVVGGSMVPILANGQREAQDELAMANLLISQQQNGVGMGTTYQGYGRLNPVPMITGSVSDANLMPTTTIGTTYPIGSALVIEPRDSFFQDYNDNASSRQNMDERQQ